MNSESTEFTSALVNNVWSNNAFITLSTFVHDMLYVMYRCMIISSSINISFHIISSNDSSPEEELSSDIDESDDEHVVDDELEDDESINSSSIASDSHK